MPKICFTNSLWCINTIKDINIYIDVIYDDSERAWSKGAPLSSRDCSHCWPWPLFFSETETRPLLLKSAANDSLEKQKWAFFIKGPHQLQTHFRPVVTFTEMENKMKGNPPLSQDLLWISSCPWQGYHHCLFCVLLLWDAWVYSNFWVMLSYSVTFMFCAICLSQDHL